MSRIQHTVQELAILFAVALIFASGCGETLDTDPSPDDSRTSGLALTMDTLGSTDIGGMDFEVTRVACSASDPAPPSGNWEATKDFEDLFLPGGIPAFENKPYDEDSDHIFADHFFLLPAGCYDVVVTPLDQQGNASEDCYSAHKDGVEVHDGKTTEILLISQCQGPARGALDVIATINHPPQIDDVDLDKFVDACGGTEVCVTASDPDDDVLEFVWTQNGNGALVNPPSVASETVNNDGSVTQCGLIETAEIDAYEFNVSVYDLAHGDNGMVRIEQLLSDQGDPHESQDDLTFPIYGGLQCPATGS